MNPQATHNDDEMPAEIDFSGGKRGQFHKADAQLNLPVYLDQQVRATLAACQRQGRGAVHPDQ